MIRYRSPRVYSVATHQKRLLLTAAFGLVTHSPILGQAFG